MSPILFDGEKKLQRLLRKALDALATAGFDETCVYPPHFNDCKKIALIEEIRKEAGMPRWPNYLKGVVRKNHPARRGAR